ncbi:MAG TPA: peptide-methionine (S)-S-oxide reductase MsrA [Accumulibacter sp.]|nr:peptide-methionine (S)-S-oxide reductase MsrA [Accumulibacter sp.]HMW18262.1 peptide-methionine (S)-S-oxide reductase MsrA [Accumulibacter sp.]HMX21801.1 peptide-methionine (S)-S-oxide reductase MsrA [Accumulibacter sp.]HMY06029.1 peptide-methionine (S)-S-oxide reductase MsrA [Accumulibacter sp.]HNC16813.1 peptide-methionine (S)-S-oxide reductase MsrA [Accumulibacter sp.]
MDKQLATLGGGCFWCLEAVFEQVSGVEHVVSGYSGGHTDRPDYQTVCGGRTGHAEVVQITFDPARCSYHELLEIFFAIHDPTTLNQQGNDIGTQYRSVIFYHGPEQKRIANELLAELARQKIWSSPIVTEVLPAPRFFAAEEYHQQYFRNHSEQTYCQLVINPKLAKFRQTFQKRLKSDR